MRMKFIGVTGGIGAGKSSVSKILEDRGAQVIDADLLSHQVVELGKPAYHQIIEEFGIEVLQNDGSLDRKRLAEIVFQKPKLRRKLETIVHAEVINAMLERINSLKRQSYKGLVVLDVPIPVEHGFLDTADTVWVVTASEETRIKRVVARSGLSVEEAKRRIQSQLSQEEYIRLADEIIENEDSIEDLRKKIEKLVSKIML